MNYNHEDKDKLKQNSKKSFLMLCLMSSYLELFELSVNVDFGNRQKLKIIYIYLPNSMLTQSLNLEFQLMFMVFSNVILVI